MSSKNNMEKEKKEKTERALSLLKIGHMDSASSAESLRGKALQVQ